MSKIINIEIKSEDDDYLGRKRKITNIDVNIDNGLVAGVSSLLSNLNRFLERELQPEEEKEENNLQTKTSLRAKKIIDRFIGQLILMKQTETEKKLFIELEKDLFEELSSIFREMKRESSFEEQIQSPSNPSKI